MKSFYEPTVEHLTRLNDEPWCCSYSRGKDSTALASWCEWLRRDGWVTVEKPKLVNSDTLVDDPKLTVIGDDFMSLLASSGWDCGVVIPLVHERLYCQILGRGLPPIHPGLRRMRWCTRSTKIDPMKRWSGDTLKLTGLRLGESAMRDGKLKKSSCAAGGECGIPEPSRDTYSPLLNWSTCQVIDWLNGHVNASIRSMMADVFAITRQLVVAYDVQVQTVNTLFGSQTKIEVGRFGCNGCPAIGVVIPKRVVVRNGLGSPLNELYPLWDFARRQENRLVRVKTKGSRIGKLMLGPIKMAIRKVLFDAVMDIQARAGIVLVRKEDEDFIRDCWANKVYPRGWSEADEVVEAPSIATLFTTV